MAKGVIPCQMIKTFDDLDFVLDFTKMGFYSSLRNETISDENYENVKKLWQIICLKNLSDLNDIYNFQDTIIVCKIFENRAKEMM